MLLRKHAANDAPAIWNHPRSHDGAITLLALALAAGIAIGWFQPLPLVWPWLVLSTGALAVIGFLRRRAAILLCSGIAITGFGAAYLTVRHHALEPMNLAALIDEQPRLVQLEGAAARGPEVRARSAGSMAIFDYRPPATYFPLRVHAMRTSDGRRLQVSGKVLVRVDETLDPFAAGTRITVSGFLRRFPVPENPDEFDYRRHALSLGQAGVLTVASRHLVQFASEDRSPFIDTLHGWRDRVRHRAGAWLASDLPDASHDGRDALLAALLLGQRDREMRELDESFRRVGLAHLLAISGLHLGVLVGFALLALRFNGRRRRWHGLAIILLVLGYLLLVETRMPVLRAGIMTIAAAIGITCGRRWRVGSLVALSAIFLLLWRPEQLFDPGFQLSFGVVLGLIHLSPHVRERWFGRPDPTVSSSAGMLGQWLATTVTVAAVAWAIATPITIFHFGMISPLGIVMSVIALPIVAVLLAVGYAKMLISVLVPWFAVVIGAFLSLTTNLLISIVTFIDALPGSVVWVPKPAAAWSLATLVLVVGWGFGIARRHLWMTSATTAVLAVWLLWPLAPFPGQPALRIDMLSVRDGSCYVVRSRGETFVFDAGSSTDLDVGRRSLVPALRALGVRRIDAIAISHANLDHYSAVLELVDAFDTEQVLLTPQMITAAAEDPAGAVAYLLGALAQRRLELVPTSAGDTRRIGQAHFRWLHPSAAKHFDLDNDTSMVIAIDVAGRRVLFTGDIQERGITDLLTAHPELQADIVELPHHGSFNTEAARFIEHLDPLLVLQSTGYMRWSRDRWKPVLGDATRLVTARDGACSVEIDDDGSVTVRRFKGPPRAQRASDSPRRLTEVHGGGDGGGVSDR